MAAATEGSTPLATVALYHLQSVESVKQPLESTHVIWWPLPACLAATTEPRPTEPATGNTKSAPWAKKPAAMVLPSVCEVKLPTKVPVPGQLDSVQAPLPGVKPRTLTFDLVVWS